MDKLFFIDVHILYNYTNNVQGECHNCPTNRIILSFIFTEILYDESSEDEPITLGNRDKLKKIKG